MILRQFNGTGIERFRNMLQMCRDNPFASVDFRLLEDATLTEVVKGSVEVTEQKFVTKGDAGQYLHSLLDPVLSHDDIMSNIGLWSWLCLFFFDSVCPTDSQDRRRVKNDYRYIYDLASWHYYRHLLFVSWRVMDITKDHHRLITSSQIDTLDHVTFYIMQKLYLVRIPCVFEVLDRIYWNQTTQRVQKGITGSTISKGDLTHRFPAVIQQLEKTYDLQRLNADKLIDLLGDEFVFPS